MCSSDLGEVAGEDVTDRSDAKGVDAGDLAGVDHEAALLEKLVEPREGKVSAFRVAERGDDWTLELRREQAAKAQASHALNEDAVVLGVAGVTDGHSAFVLEFRSEERRVGKECRSRWSRYHSKKKKETDAV